MSWVRQWSYSFFQSKLNWVCACNISSRHQFPVWNSQNVLCASILWALGFFLFPQIEAYIYTSKGQSLQSWWETSTLKPRPGTSFSPWWCLWCVARLQMEWWHELQCTFVEIKIWTTLLRETLNDTLNRGYVRPQVGWTSMHIAPWYMI
jgi:hypothetical protein